MRGPRCGTLLSVLLTAVLFPREGLAQLPVSITPAVGVYFPLSSTIKVSDGTTAKQSTALALGARIALRASVLFGLEGSVFYTGSNVKATNGATGGDASLFLFSVRGVYYLTPPLLPARFYLAGGGALIVRNGDFYEGLTSTTDLGGNAAVGLRAGMGPVGVRIEVEDYVYPVNLKSAGGFETGSRLQNDLVGSLAVSIPFGP